jgi:DNA-binding transcriptional MerR regulator/quercetin dioxygenase-like cupin family protein
MAHTVKQVAQMSGVSVRALHFYDETGLLKPARVGANGYRYYEEPQLLKLQQILFYRELGFELKEIKKILGRRNFEKVAALQSHRAVLQKNISRSRALIETVDNTIKHLKGTKVMESNELFAGFKVGAGEDRFGERIMLGGEPNDCKLSAEDTGGAVAVFEFSTKGGWPRHLHRDQDEWVYVVEGEFDFLIGDKRFRAGPGESVFLPRAIGHVWSCVNEKEGKVINLYQPAGKMEDFFRELGKPFKDLITAEQLANNSFTLQQVQAMKQLFESHGMELLRPENWV